MISELLLQILGPLAGLFLFFCFAAGVMNSTDRKEACSCPDCHQAPCRCRRTNILPHPAWVPETDYLILALAQELREYADAAEEAGSNIESTEGLLEEVDLYFNSTQEEERNNEQ